ncbi:MAG: PIN domain-containing protein [Propionibacteriaceae bacterium]|jgi:predicted nucleic acid-binding protein|nr:PIN domain-containing protein [Propionibacteriaceae bacterium]
MKVLLDVNVVIDVLERRPAFFANSYAVLQAVAGGRVEGFVAAGSIADIHYILRRAGLTAGQARMALASLIQIVEVGDTTAADINDALVSPMTDPEDALLAACAKRLRADYIVTRDGKDFVNSPVPAITPAQLLTLASLARLAPG